MHRRVLGFVNVLSPFFFFFVCFVSHPISVSSACNSMYISLGQCLVIVISHSRGGGGATNTMGGWEEIRTYHGTAEHNKKHIPEIRHLEKIILEVKTRLRP